MVRILVAPVRIARTLTHQVGRSRELSVWYHFSRRLRQSLVIQSVLLRPRSSDLSHPFPVDAPRNGQVPYNDKELIRIKRWFVIIETNEDGLIANHSGDITLSQLDYNGRYLRGVGYGDIRAWASWNDPSCRYALIECTTAGSAASERYR